MRRRSRTSGSRATGSRTARGARRSELTTFSPPEHDPLSDSRLRPLVERYASLAGATLKEVGPHLVELRVPEEDRAFFDERDRVLVAFAVPALETSPDAEMAVIGSAFVEQLLAAIRARGARLALGLVPPGPAADEQAPALGVPVKNGTAATPTIRAARHPVGRLVARVLIRAGATVEEHLVESGFFDLATGAPLPREAAEICAPHCAPAEGREQRAARRQGALLSPGTALSSLPPAGGAQRRAPAELVDLMTADLRARLAPRLDRLRAEAERALVMELRRIDGYYHALIADAAARAGDGSATASDAPATPGGDAIEAIEAEHARRRLEEERRHQVRAVVHPLQIVEMEMLVQRAEWSISTATGQRGVLSARRYLGGSAAWSLTCPTCAREPSALLVCADGRVACAACAQECSVCAEAFRASDGMGACHVDGSPACAEHARACPACRRQHCTEHEAECAEGDHSVCTSCLAPCALCGRSVCPSHAVPSAESAPRGSRRLCAQCVVHCEGGRSEPVGRDEAVRCASCERFVCERHQARCAVDGAVHCSTHLVRTDESRKLVCESHRAACDHEPEAVFAADEVGRCASCGKLACEGHGGPCAEDGAWHCLVHLAPLQDRADAYACEQHRTMCHVESAVFSPAETITCPVCARRACSAHVRECASCGRQVCVAEWEQASSRCATCRQLAPYRDPSPAELAAATDAANGDVPKPKKWRAARDATHLVVELSHGLRRRTVFAVRHGESRAERVKVHARGGVR